MIRRPAVSTRRAIPLGAAFATGGTAQAWAMADAFPAPIAAVLATREKPQDMANTAIAQAGRFIGLWVSSHG